MIINAAVSQWILPKVFLGDCQFAFRNWLPGHFFLHSLPPGPMARCSVEVWSLSPRSIPIGPLNWAPFPPQRAMQPGMLPYSRTFKEEASQSGKGRHCPFLPRHLCPPPATTATKPACPVNLEEGQARWQGHQDPSQGGPMGSWVGETSWDC